MESDGRYHSNWLNMMYSRLKLARNLLYDNGVIFISIDDNELNNLKKMCDEIFGEENFITSFIWEKTQHFGRQKLNYYSNAEYVLCYGKRIISNGLKEVLMEYEKSELEDAPLYNASNPEKSILFPKGTVKFNIPDGVYYQSTDEKYILETEVFVKNGKNENDFKLKFRSRWSKEKVLSELDNGTTYWVKSENFAIRAIYGDLKTSIESPRQIIFTNSNNPLFSKNRFDIKVGTSEEGSKDLEKLLGSSYFSYPKPSSLIGYLLSLVSNPDDKTFIKDGYFLDFFSGSSTTAQAIMQLNSMDEGIRKFIMVQIPESTDEKSEAFEAGYKNICEIGKERIRRAGDKIVKESGNKDLDIGFKVFKLDSSNLEKWDPDYDDLEQTLLVSQDNIKEGRTQEDLIYEIMLKYGIDLTLPIEKYESENTIYSIGFGALLVCLDNKITKDITDSIIELASEDVSRVVFKDNGFASDADKTNIKETLRTNGIDEFITI